MREPTYGEVAYHCLQGSVGSPLSFDQLSPTSQQAWENTAASVIAEFRKRQLALGHQTKPSWLAAAQAALQKAEAQADDVAEPYGIVGAAFRQFVEDHLIQDHRS